MMRLVKTKSGRSALTFTAYDPQTSSERNILLWWDKIDQHYVLTELAEQVAYDVEPVEILNEE